MLVVDDGSTDGTGAAAAAAGAEVVRLPFNLGIGGAVQTGYVFAHEHGYEVAVQLDGDGQHDARYIPELLARLTDGGGYNMVTGSRFLEPAADDDGGGVSVLGAPPRRHRDLRPGRVARLAPARHRSRPPGSG